jgi:hypothetical protein
MDRGVLTDTNGREANFKNVILVMTTNAGAAQAARRTIGFTKQDHSTDAMEILRKSFSPEFRNRLDAVVQFQPLAMEHILRVVDKFLIELEAQLHEKNVSLSATPAAREWLAQHGFDPLMGARPMARVIQEKIKRPLADELLFGKLVQGGRVGIDVREGELVVDAQAEPEKLLPVTVYPATRPLPAHSPVTGVLVRIDLLDTAHGACVASRRDARRLWAQAVELSRSGDLDLRGQNDRLAVAAERHLVMGVCVPDEKQLRAVSEGLVVGSQVDAARERRGRRGWNLCLRSRRRGRDK